MGINLYLAFPHHFSRDVEMHGKQMGKIPQPVGMLNQTHVEPADGGSQTGSQQTKADDDNKDDGS